MRQRATFLLLLAIAQASFILAQDDPARQQAIAASVNHPDRPATDKARDADRKPAQTLAFYDIRPGMKVADLMTGGGYYTELLARLVGPEGKVYAQNNKYSSRYGKPVEQRIAEGVLPSTEYLVRELEELNLPEGQLDAVFMVLFYHDTYWMNVDRKKMNQQVLKSLKPGGIYAIVDHHAEAGSGPRDVQTLHRVDADLVKKELLEAGFEFVAESDVLRHPEDDRKTNVFLPNIRGKTDQFVFKFRKPL